MVCCSWHELAQDFFEWCINHAVAQKTAGTFTWERMEANFFYILITAEAVSLEYSKTYMKRVIVRVFQHWGLARHLTSLMFNRLFAFDDVWRNDNYIARSQRIKVLFTFKILICFKRISAQIQNNDVIKNLNLRWIYCLFFIFNSWHKPC